MKRRTLVAVLGGSAASWPVLAQSQRPARLAWIEPGAPATSGGMIAAMREGLADNGLIDGRDYLLDAYLRTASISALPL